MKLWMTLAGATLLCLTASAALAGSSTTPGAGDVLNLTYNGDSPALVGHISSIPSTDVWVGPSNFTVNHKGSGDFAQQVKTASIQAWCIDVHDWISSYTGDFTITTLADAPYGYKMGTDKARDLTIFFNGATPLLAQNSDAVHCAAFQAAVWEIVNETAGKTYSVTADDFTVADHSGYGFEAIANTWLGAANFGKWQAAAVSDSSGLQPVYALVPADHSVQNFALMFTGVGSSKPVPEPITMLGAFLGISSLGLYVRKRTRAA